MSSQPSRAVFLGLAVLTVTACSPRPPSPPAPAAPTPNMDAFMAVQTTSTESSPGEASADAQYFWDGHYHVQGRCTGTGHAVVVTSRTDGGSTSTDRAALSCPGEVVMPSFPAKRTTVVTVTLRGTQGSVGLLGQIIRE